MVTIIAQDKALISVYNNKKKQKHFDIFSYFSIKEKQNKTTKQYMVLSKNPSDEYSEHVFS